MGKRGKEMRRRREGWCSEVNGGDVWKRQRGEEELRGEWGQSEERAKGEG